MLPVSQEVNRQSQHVRRTNYAKPTLTEAALRVPKREMSIRFERALKRANQARRPKGHPQKVQLHLNAHTTFIVARPSAPKSQDNLTLRDKGSQYGPKQEDIGESKLEKKRINTGCERG